MEKSYRRAKEKFTGVVFDILAVGKGNVKDRLLKAYTIFLHLRKSDFPLELQKDWEKILIDLRRKEAIRNEDGDVIMGNVQNTLRHMKNSTGSKIAEQIVNLYRKLENYK